MVVHPEDIDLAGGAVVRPRRLPAVSLLSIRAGLRFIILTNKRRFESRWYRTCIAQCSSQVSDVCQEKEGVQNDEVDKPLEVQRNPFDVLLVHVDLLMPEVDVDPIPQPLRKRYQRKSLHHHANLPCKACRGLHALNGRKQALNGRKQATLLARRRGHPELQNLILINYR